MRESTAIELKRHHENSKEAGEKRSSWNVASG